MIASLHQCTSSRQCRKVMQSLRRRSLHFGPHRPRAHLALARSDCKGYTCSHLCSGARANGCIEQGKSQLPTQPPVYCAPGWRDADARRREYESLHRSGLTGIDLECRKFYARKIWARVRFSFLQRNPLCAHCLQKGQITPSTDADHEPTLREQLQAGMSGLDHSHLQALCKACHSRKTATEQARLARMPISDVAASVTHRDAAIATTMSREASRDRGNNRGVPETGDGSPAKTAPPLALSSQRNGDMEKLRHGET